jgi:hypothetical protein
VTVVLAEGEVVVTADGSAIPGQLAGSMNRNSAPVTASGALFGRNFLTGTAAVFGGNILTDVARGAGQIIGTGVRAGFDYGFDSIGLASDLNESFNAVEVTFGEEIAEDLGILAREAPRTLRVTQVAFNEYAVRFSAFARQVVGEGGDVTGFLDELTTRGADFASVYNLDVAEALQLFQSGLAGEMEPLRKYGVFLDANTVSTYAYANGIAESGTQLTQAQKVQAAYGSLLEQTSRVQGDATNTAGELAAQQRALAVGWQEAQTTLGTYLLPGFNTLVGIANEQLLPALGDVIDRIGPRLGEALDGVSPKIGDLVDEVAPLLEDLIIAGGEAIPDVIDGLGEMAAAAPEWIEAFNTIDQGVRDLDAGFRDFQDTLIESRADRIEWFEGWIDDVNTWAEPVNEAVNDFFYNAFIEPGNRLQAHLYPVGIDAMRGLGRGVKDGKAIAIEEAGLAAFEMLRRSKNVLGIASPSKEYEEVGENVDEGLALGIRRKAYRVEDETAAMLPSPADSRNKMTSGTGNGRMGGDTFHFAAGAIVIDASSIQELTDITDMLRALPRVARSGRGKVA